MSGRKQNFLNDSHSLTVFAVEQSSNCPFGDVQYERVGSNRVEDPECKVTFVSFLTKLAMHICIHVNLAHQLDLLNFLCNIVLVDTECVDPQSPPRSVKVCNLSHSRMCHNADRKFSSISRPYKMIISARLGALH